MVLKQTKVRLIVVSVVVLTGFITCSTFMELNMLQLFGDMYVNTNPVEAVYGQNQTWDVIISTYMRSGSTFLGTNIGHRKGAFFFYEPLWQNFSFKYHREDGKLCDALKPTCANNGTFAKKALDSALKFLNDIYNCRLAPQANRIHEYMHDPLFAGPSWHSFQPCRTSKKSKRECLLELESVCRNAKHRVAKVLRLDFTHIEKLLIANPRLKAVLLLRDPRGTLTSHISTFWFPIERNNVTAIANDAEVLCSRMNRDINAAKSLLTLYPNRVKIVQYEDFDDPVRKLTRLFSFLNMDVGRMTLKSVPNWGYTYIEKSSDIFSYRKKVEWDTVQTIDSHCVNVYRKLGLVQYKDEKHLRNVSQSPIIDALPYSLEI